MTAAPLRFQPCTCACGGPDALQLREPPADVSVASLAELGALVGDPARANMLVALLHSGCLTARELADGAGVTPQTASGHLGRLLMAGMVSVRRRGRYNDYRLASEDAGALLLALHVAGSRLRAAPLLIPAPDRSELALLRSCREHMAGRLAVSLAESLLDGDPAPGRALTGSGRGALARWGLELASRERTALDGCLDWSEGAAHIGGALGAAMLSHSLALGWVRRARSGARLALTPAGRVGFQRRFGVSLDRLGTSRA